MKTDENQETYVIRRFPVSVVLIGSALNRLFELFARDVPDIKVVPATVEVIEADNKALQQIELRINKCSNRSIEMRHPTLFGNNDSPTDRPTNQPTDGHKSAQGNYTSNKQQNL